MASGAITTLLGHVCGFLLPPLCDGCRGRLSSPLDGLCPSCSTRLRILAAQDPALHQARAVLCASGNISRFIALYRFEPEGPLRPMIHGLKYQGLTRTGVRLGRMLARHMLMESAPGVDAVVPVPLYRTRRRERGYNQAECIARGLAEVLRIPVDAGILVRVRATASQTGLDRESRRHNVRGAFSVNPRRRSAVRGRAFLIVDDVVTTGSTLQECAASLCAEGARRCVACAVAVAGEGIS